MPLRSAGDAALGEAVEIIPVRRHSTRPLSSSSREIAMEFHEVVSDTTVGLTRWLGPLVSTQDKLYLAPVRSEKHVQQMMAGGKALCFSVDNDLVRHRGIHARAGRYTTRDASGL
jgi:hypothetical protein